MSEEAATDLTPDAAEALDHVNKTGEFPVNIDDDDWYSDAVKKRIGKEVGKRKTLQGQLEEVESDRERLRRELKESREKLSSYEKQADEDLDDRAKDLKARRDKALDDGELGQYNDLNDELMEVKIELRDRARRQKAEPAVEPQTDKPQTARAAADWLNKNSDWVNTDQEKAAHAAKIEQQLFREGFTADDPDTYKELDRRLSSYDNAPVDDLEDDTPPQRGSATAGVPRGDASNTPPRGKPGVLTRADLQRMQAVGLDPNDPKHRKGWLDRNKPL